MEAVGGWVVGAPPEVGAGCSLPPTPHPGAAASGAARAPCTWVVKLHVVSRSRRCCKGVSGASQYSRSPDPVNLRDLKLERGRAPVSCRSPTRQGLGLNFKLGRPVQYSLSSHCLLFYMFLTLLY